MLDSFGQYAEAWICLSKAKTLRRKITNTAALEQYYEKMDHARRELGGFDWIETRYEDVVANLESEGRRVTNFLGLPWHEAQAAYYETARRKFVHSPTYNEVTQPVYNQAVGRWKHYAEALAPLQAGLEKYRRAFGYG